MEPGPHSANTYFGCLGKHSQTETGFKTNFLPMKGQNSYCIVLTFKSEKILWLVKEILVSKALGIYFLWILMASINMTTRTMYGCLIVNKVGSWRLRVSQSDGNTAVLSVEMWAFLSGFSCPTPTLLLFVPALFGPREATHWELLGMKRVNARGKKKKQKNWQEKKRELIWHRDPVRSQSRHLNLFGIWTYSIWT